jgi:hypothetical protein
VQQQSQTLMNASVDPFASPPVAINTPVQQGGLGGALGGMSFALNPPEAVTSTEEKKEDKPALPPQGDFSAFDDLDVPSTNGPPVTVPGPGGQAASNPFDDGNAAPNANVPPYGQAQAGAFPSGQQGQMPYSYHPNTAPNGQFAPGMPGVPGGPGVFGQQQQAPVVQPNDSQFIQGPNGQMFQVVIGPNGQPTLVPAQAPVAPGGYPQQQQQQQQFAPGAPNGQNVPVAAPEKAKETSVFSEFGKLSLEPGVKRNSFTSAPVVPPSAIATTDISMTQGTQGSGTTLSMPTLPTMDATATTSTTVSVDSTMNIGGIGSFASAPAPALAPTNTMTMPATTSGPDLGMMGGFASVPATSGPGLIGDMGSFTSAPAPAPVSNATMTIPAVVEKTADPFASAPAPAPALAPPSTMTTPAVNTVTDVSMMSGSSGLSNPPPAPMMPPPSSPVASNNNTSSMTGMNSMNSMSGMSGMNSMNSTATTTMSSGADPFGMPQQSMAPPVSMTTIQQQQQQAAPQMASPFDLVAPQTTAASTTAQSVNPFDHF